MGRKKIAIEKIKDEKTLLVTFAKRKLGLFSKAFELSELCECEVAILIFTKKDRLHMYSSSHLPDIVQKYNERKDRGDLMTNDDIIRRRQKRGSDKVKATNQPCDSTQDDSDVHFEQKVEVNPLVSSSTTSMTPATQDFQGGFESGGGGGGGGGGGVFLDKTFLRSVEKPPPEHQHPIGEGAPLRGSANHPVVKFPSKSMTQEAAVYAAVGPESLQPEYFQPSMHEFHSHQQQSVYVQGGCVESQHFFSPASQCIGSYVYQNLEPGDDLAPSFGLIRANYDPGTPVVQEECKKTYSVSTKESCPNLGWKHLPCDDPCPERPQPFLVGKLTSRNAANEVVLNTPDPKTFPEPFRNDSIQ